MSTRHRIQQFIRANRRAAPFALAAKAARKYLKYWYNEHFYEFEKNGEAFALRCFATWAAGRDGIVIWDVGAHAGEWSDEALALVPTATVHSFEALPRIAECIPAHPNRVVHAIGLSDRTGPSTITYNPDYNTLNTMNELEASAHNPHFASAIRVPVELSSGDDLLATVACPHFLKIDVEGHETSVLRGCQDMLKSASAPVLLQLEYGQTYLPANANLRHIYELLPGYAIGRLYPTHVEFEPYDPAEDHFRMGNLIAVRDEGLRKILAGR